MQPRILLIIDDDTGICEQLSWCFDNLKVITANNRKEALSLVRRFMPAVVTLDLGLPPFTNTTEEGLLTLKEILAFNPKTKVIMVTGQNDRRIAMQAIAMGAYDFYQKPIEPDELKLIVSRAFYLSELESENQRFLEQGWLNGKETSLESGLGQFGILSASSVMQKTNRLAEKVAPTNATVLLLGESGTGKERFARAIHGLSDRKNKPFIAINCAAIPENLLESELFGHERGAFTGASKQVMGKIETAQGGTLFLDEIGDLPLSLQPKLLRFLQERVIERLGGRQQINVDVRVICATFQPLDEFRAANRFREDLYYRISEIVIPIPPLCDRGQDSLLLAHAFLRRYASELKRPIKKFNQSALAAIERYTWPGNVRELENKIKRAVILCENTQITADDLDLNINIKPDIISSGDVSKVQDTSSAIQDEFLTENEYGNIISNTNISFIEDVQFTQSFGLKALREKTEKEAIIRAIEYAGDNISKAADILGVTRPTLYNLMDKLGLREKLDAKAEKEFL